MQALSQTVLRPSNSQGNSHRSCLHHFESAFARVVGVQHAIALDSPMTALRLALEAAGVGKGDEVITSPYNSPLAAEAILGLGARPVFVDVKEYTLNINSRLISEAVTKRSKAILVPHTGGLPADIPNIRLIAEMYGLRVIEDATYAFPAEYRGRMVGGESHLACFGFPPPGKACEEGAGVLCTNNVQWAEQCHSSSYTLSEAVAVPALAQLSEEESMWMRRTEIARRYNRAFELQSEFQIPADRFDCEHAWRLYMLRVNFEHVRIDRDEFIAELRARKVYAEVHFIPMHAHPSFRDKLSYIRDDFPVAYREYLREVSLPVHSNMSDDDVERVIRGVMDTLQEYTL